MEKTKVMIAGLPGKMATLIAEHVDKVKDMNLVPFTLAEEKGTLQVGETEIWKIAPEWHESRLKEIGPDIIVDFSNEFSDFLERNVKLYCECGVPFVIGTIVKMSEQLGLKRVVEKLDSSTVIITDVCQGDCNVHVKSTVDAIRFLAMNQEKGKVFHMSDVLLSNVK